MDKKKDIKYIFTETNQERFPVFLSRDEVKKARGFHLSMDEYKPTPLVELNELAKVLKVSKVFVKDESYRFGLNAFKALGGTYSVARLLCGKLNVSIEEASFEYFNRSDVKEQIKDMVFVTATDGNHGRGLAWAATKLGCKSVVYMPKGSSLKRLQAIIDEGADASITELNYDDAVRLAKDKADENGWFMVQDTAWQGYEDIPNWITQGYTTMADEALEQLQEMGIERPTHVFLQAGVGSFAGGVLGYYANVFKENCPITTVVEPDAADCIYRSATVGDGNPHFVGGELNTIMAGLACGEPNHITWEVLRDYATAYISCPDYVAVRGMRLLAHPNGSDKVVVSGESGAAGVGAFSYIMQDSKLTALKEQLKLDENAVVLCFNTEGDTDPDHYQKIISVKDEMDTI